MKKGKVKFFNVEKGYGFIIEEYTAKEYFVHVTKTYDDLKQDDKVSFNIESGRKGDMAINVKLQ